MLKRKQYTASQKAQIVLETLKEEKTVNQIASAYGIHPNILYRWKKQALENLPRLFEERTRTGRIARPNKNARRTNCTARSAA